MCYTDKKMDHRSCILGFICRFLLALSLNQVKCSEYTKQALKKTTVVSDLKKINGPISLAFVFDRTGSMYDDLIHVRAGATRIFNSTVQNGTSSVQNYILVPFRDPDVGPVFETEDPALFQKALNDIHVQGGKDCPEMSVTAIKLALELSLPGSVVYVFTDAAAKDHRVLPDVVRLIREKNIRVNFILSGNCKLETNFRDRETYEKIAILSSGQIVNLNKSEVGEIWKFVAISIKANRTNIYSVDKFTRGERTYIVKIDPNIKEVIITVSGKDVEVIIRNTLGELVSLGDKNVDVLLNVNSAISVLVSNPRPGNWNITVSSNGRQTLRVEAISNRWQEMKTDHTSVVIPEVNECADAIHDCSSEEVCLDLPYRFTCRKKCSHGFQITKEGGCKDVDECIRYEDICRDRSCVNTRGSYRCKKICPRGFEGHGDTCRDIDECSQNRSICGSQECINLIASYRCQQKCSRGYTRDENGICKDINECMQYTSICGNKDCFNTQGSYRCLTKCASGFSRDQYSDCKDVNECVQSSTICGNQECVNIPGSYRCQQKCLRGFIRNQDGSCEDVNECYLLSTICGVDEACINEPGYYRCQVKCLQGFTRDEDGNCKDVNECFQHRDICGEQDCLNLPGSYQCEEKCLSGFVREENGYCKDVNECLEKPRRCEYMCENTAGSFQCLCPRGTRLGSDGMTCSRISACPLRGYGRCQYQCNTKTGKCECPSGYTVHWDEVSCVDVNECLTGHQTCGTRECFNTLGKYHCLNVSCPQGYHPTTDGYCTMQCIYRANQCPAQYTKLQHTSVSIPRHLPVNTDFLHLQPYIPSSTSRFENVPCYCRTYFYPVQDSNHIFGVYQIDQVGVLYNRVVFDEPGFYEFNVVSDYLNAYGSVVSRTTYRVFVDVGHHMF